MWLCHIDSTSLGEDSAIQQFNYFERYSCGLTPYLTVILVCEPQKSLLLHGKTTDKESIAVFSMPIHLS